MIGATRQRSRRMALCLLTAAILLFSACGLTARPASGAGSMAACIDAEGLTLCRLDDGSTVRLVSGRHLSSPVFSPDGRCLYYKNSSDVFCLSLNGGRPLLAAANAVFVGDYSAVGDLRCGLPKQPTYFTLQRYDFFANYANLWR